MTTTMIFFIFIFSFSSFLCLFPFLCYFTRCGILSLSHFLFYIQAIWPWQTIFNATHKCAMWLEEPPPLNPWYTYGMTFKSLMYGLHVCRRPTQNTWFAACVDGKLWLVLQVCVTHSLHLTKWKSNLKKNEQSIQDVVNTRVYICHDQTFYWRSKTIQT